MVKVAQKSVISAMAELQVEVRGEIIIVTEPETGFYATYSKPKGETWLKTQHMPLGTGDFKARAWDVANDKAVSSGGSCRVERGGLP